MDGLLYLMSRSESEKRENAKGHALGIQSGFPGSKPNALHTNLLLIPGFSTNGFLYTCRKERLSVAHALALDLFSS